MNCIALLHSLIFFIFWKFRLLEQEDSPSSRLKNPRLPEEDILRLDEEGPLILEEEYRLTPDEEDLVLPEEEDCLLPVEDFLLLGSICSALGNEDLLL